MLTSRELTSYFADISHTQDRLASYTFANSQGNETIPQPCLSILPTQVCCAIVISAEMSPPTFSQDPVADWVLAANLLKSASFLPNLTQTVRTVFVPYYFS